MNTGDAAKTVLARLGPRKVENHVHASASARLLLQGGCWVQYRVCRHVSAPVRVLPGKENTAEAESAGADQWGHTDRRMRLRYRSSDGTGTELKRSQLRLYRTRFRRARMSERPPQAEPGKPPATK